jgi:hypothetical protein
VAHAAGLLASLDRELCVPKPSIEHETGLVSLLAARIAAGAGKPMVTYGENGIYSRAEELGEPFRVMRYRPLHSLARQALETGQLRLGRRRALLGHART